MLSLRNPDNVEYLIQSWVDHPQAGAEKIPFIITPPLFRQGEKKDFDLRVMKNEVALPEDRRSWFWLNVKAIPATQRTDKNLLQVTVRTRMKIFYRPDSLKARDDDKWFSAVHFSRTADGITLSNPTPYYINIHELNVNDQKVADADMVAPFSNASYKTEMSPAAIKKVTLSVINDYGTPTKSLELSQENHK